MSEHKFNPNAIAKATSSDVRQVIDIGNGCGFLEFTIRAVPDAEGIMHAMLIAVGGKVSRLGPMAPVGVVCGELGRIPIAELQRHFGGVVESTVSDAPQTEAKPD